VKKAEISGRKIGCAPQNDWRNSRRC